MNRDDALAGLTRAAEAMARFSFSAVEQQRGYRAALAAFCRRKRALRDALATWKAAHGNR